MTAIQTPFGSNRGKYNAMGNSSLINCHAEIGGEQGRSRYTITQSDGLKSFETGIDTPTRGAIYLPDLGLVYSVHSSSIWKIDSAGAETLIGSIPGTDLVELTRNQKATVQIGVRCDAGVYIVENDAVTPLVDEDLPDVATMDQQGVYTVYGIEDGRYFISGINEMTTISGLDFDAADQSADLLIRVKALGSEIYLFGQKTIEVDRNTGQADFPYEPIGETIRTGIGAKFSVQEFDNSLAWIGDDFIVYRLDGFTPVPISSHEVEAKIRDDAGRANIESTQWTRGGHHFYVITGTDWSYAFDAATQQWAERKSYKESRWRGRVALEAFGEVLMGDRLSGDFFKLDSNTFDENGTTMVSEITFPDMQAFPNGGIVDAFHIDFVTGKGVRIATASGSDPKLMLDWSDDGGNTYGNVRNLPLGKEGVYKTRLTTRRLGRFARNGRVWRMRISDPVPRALSLADAQLRLTRK